MDIGHVPKGFFAQLPRCLVGLEACGSAHHWARELIKLWHDARMMPPAYVIPYRCAPKARITSGGRFHPESCRLIAFALSANAVIMLGLDSRHGRDVTRRD